jgi:glutamate-1-semialdehyde aminotransferase
MKETPKLNLTKSRELYDEASGLIPGGVLGARKPTDFIAGEYPVFIDSGQGCRLTDVDGNEFIDFLCGYGPMILGYREKEVDEAVQKQINEKGFCFTLSQKFQNDLAKKIIELVPSAEMCIFLKDRFRRNHSRHPYRQGVHKQAQGHAMRLPWMA